MSQIHPFNAIPHFSGYPAHDNRLQNSLKLNIFDFPLPELDIEDPEKMHYFHGKYSNSPRPPLGYSNDRYGPQGFLPMNYYGEFPHGFDPMSYPSPYLQMPFSPHHPEPSEMGSQHLLQKLEMSGRVPSKEKFRRMICQTYICCGGCPYNERCVFLHDERIELRGFRTRPNKSSKAIIAPKDSFFWPDMPKERIYQKLDYLGLPSVCQPYDIPFEFSDPMRDNHDRAMYSLWNHFLEFCMKRINNNSYRGETRTVDLVEQTYVDSPYSRIDPTSPLTKLILDDESSVVANKFLPFTKRLPVFVSLSSSYNSNSKSHIGSPTSMNAISFDSFSNDLYFPTLNGRESFELDKDDLNFINFDIFDVLK